MANPSLHDFSAASSETVPNDVNTTSSTTHFAHRRFYEVGLGLRYGSIAREERLRR